VADITVLVQSPGSEYWGQSTWGSNDFGGSGISLTTSSGTATTTADANVTVSGISLTSSVGAASGFASFSTSVTGVSSSISQGSVVPGTGDIVNLTTAGLLQTAIGNETAEGIIEVGWGGDAWNVNAWGQLQPFENVTGQALATSIGSTTITANADVSVTGQSITSSVGTQTAGISFATTVTGQSLTTSIGTEVVDIGVPVTGIAASTFSGSVTIDDTFLIGEGWGRDTYGNLAWGVNYSAKNNTGLSLTSSIGSESSFTDVTVSVTGQALGMTFGVYSVTANADLSITVAEHTMTSSLGSTSLTQTTTETLTGQSLTTSVGNAPAGLFLDVPVTGSSLTTSQGTTSLTQTTTEPVTGQSLTTSIGTITQVPQVIVGVSGLSLTSAMGEEGTQANARVVPTGQSLTSSINSVNVTPWQEVDLGVNNTWQDAA
jgi:hypothetical protein